MEGLSLIDVAAAEDDLWISPGPVKADENFQLETLGARDGEPLVDLSEELDQVPELAVSPKQKKVKGNSFNLRKSLAWDSAFLTSEGVLNTEELGIVNSTFNKAEASKLPGIQEETRRSGESTSTLDSESWVLENLETELFDNVRASIQRSLGKCDMAPGVPRPSTKDQRGLNASRLGSKDKAGRMSQNKMKLPPINRSHEVSKEKAKLPPAARVSSSGTSELMALPRPSRSLPKTTLPRVLSKTTDAPGNAQKRSSSGSMVSRQSVRKIATNSASMTFRSIGSPRSSPNKTSGNAFSGTISPSHSTSISSSSDSTTESPVLSNKKRTAAGNITRSLTGAAISKPLVRTSRNKIANKGQGDLTSSAEPATKCPSISPSSSIDSMVSVISEASSSASNAVKSSILGNSFDAKSSSSSPSLKPNNCLPPIVKMRSPVLDDASRVASGDVSKLGTNTSSQGRGFKPSGLRMPTPKVGYFDAEKSLGQNVELAQPVRPPTKLQYTRSATNKSVSTAVLRIERAQLSFTRRTNPISSIIAQEEPRPETTICQREDVLSLKGNSELVCESNLSSHQGAEGKAQLNCHDKGVQVEDNLATNKKELQTIDTITEGDVVIFKGNSDPVSQSKTSPCQVSGSEAQINQISKDLKVEEDNFVALNVGKENIPTNITGILNESKQSEDHSMLIEVLSQMLSSISLADAQDKVL